MWRFIQNVSRTTRGFWNATRPAPSQTLHQDGEELYHNNTEKPNGLDVLKRFNFNSNKICRREDQADDKEKHDWYRNQNFYHNFWYYECQHCQFLEAVGLGTALLLGCKLSQLWKLKSLQERRRQDVTGSPVLSHRLYNAAFGDSSLSYGNYVLPPHHQCSARPQQPINQSNGSHSCARDYNSDVTWSKSPPEEQIPATENDSLDYDATYIAAESNNDSTISADANNPNEQQKSHHHHHHHHRVSETLLKEFSSEINKLSRIYDGVSLNHMGLKFSKMGQYNDAIKAWEEAGQLGCGDGWFNLGLCYETGRGVDVDIGKASTYYQKGSDCGSAASAHNLALLVLNKHCHTPYKNSGVELLHFAATQGLAQSQTELGALYVEDGDYENAANWFEKAAKQKDPESEYFLALCYENGWGVTQNLCKAADLYSRASKQHLPQAMACLAHYFEHGLGGLPVDESEALKLYSEAAKTGCSQAQQNMNRLQLQQHNSESKVDKDYNFHIKISQSAPALSEYLRQHITPFGEINWDEVVQSSHQQQQHPHNSHNITKSSTMTSLECDFDVINCNGCNGAGRYFLQSAVGEGMERDGIEYLDTDILNKYYLDTNAAKRTSENKGAANTTNDEDTVLECPSMRNSKLDINHLYHHTDAEKDVNSSNSKSVKFQLGDDNEEETNSLVESDWSDSSHSSSLLFTLDGGAFGDNFLSFPKQLKKSDKKTGIRNRKTGVSSVHRSSCFNNFSDFNFGIESKDDDESDISIVFDDHFSSFQAVSSNLVATN